MVNDELVEGYTVLTRRMIVNGSFIETCVTVTAGFIYLTGVAVY